MFATGRVLIPSSQALQIVMLPAPSDSEGGAPSGLLPWIVETCDPAYLLLNERVSLFYTFRFNGWRQHRRLCRLIGNLLIYRGRHSFGMYIENFRW